MRGKEKCKLLKAIRREIAETNGIVYLTSECTFEGECKGTCPKCDAEIRYLDTEINRLIAEGKKVTLAGLSLNTFDSALTAPNPVPAIQPASAEDHVDDKIVVGESDFAPPTMGSIESVDDRTLGRIVSGIDELDISVRSYNCLRRANINDIPTLCSKTVRELRCIRNMGRKSLAEIHSKLQALGLDFASEELTPEMVKNTIYGFAVADALGVPAEFMGRSYLRDHPISDMIGGGIHKQKAGTWSDDTSMTLATLDSLAYGLDYADIMDKFRSWVDNAAYTATNVVFDIGNTTHRAIQNYKHGIAPLESGCRSEHDNGNGSLMRIIPAIFYVRHKMKTSPLCDKLAVIHNISALTHGHPRSQVACGVYYFILDMLLDSPFKSDVRFALQSAELYYSNAPEFAAELSHFERLFSVEFKNYPESEIKSSGYVIDTLEAAVWCLLNTENYHDCVLKAVNLGEDTDTVAAVAGGLAGCLYCGCGESGIPLEWMEALLNSNQIDELCDQFFSGPAKKEIAVPIAAGLIEKGGINSNKVLDMTIEEMDFGTRTFMCLQRHGVHTVRDLTMMTLEDYMKVHNLGRKCVHEIETKLEMLGLQIADS